MNNDNEFVEGDSLESKFQRYCRQDGQPILADVCRRNGRKTLVVRPSHLEDPQTGLSPAEYLGLLRDLYSNLTKVQRRTWHKLLNQRTILQIAKEEQVKPSAIYARIHSMVNRNGFCKRWWRRRDMRNQYE